MKDLFPHNQKAYRAVMKHFHDGYSRACIVHATGTGKSYVITAVASHFGRILFMSPNDYVLEQVRTTIRKLAPETDRRTVYKNYTKLLYELAAGVTYFDCFDLIVLDEFHRTGAEKWGNAVLEVIKSNPSAKVLGTSATPVRYLDGRRDMAQEMFDGQIVSELTLGEAWARNILLSPLYVVAVENFSSMRDDALQRIGTSFLSDRAREDLMLKLSAAQKDWEMAGGLNDILRKYITPDMKRIIVFCRNVDDVMAYSEIIGKWFTQAGLPNHRISSVYWSRDTTKSTQKQQMQQFCTDEEGIIKIMLCINMLNEGIHVKDVDAAILLRRTQSPIIYLQQIGRALSAERKHSRRTVILDLQNNIWNIESDIFREERQRYDRCRTSRNTLKGEFIEIVDTTMDIRRLAEHIDEICTNASDWRRWNENYAKAKSYFKNFGYFPNVDDDRDTFKYFKNWCYRKHHERYPERMKMLEDIGFKYEHYEGTWIDKYNMCKKFYEEYGHFPAYSENEVLSDWARDWWTKNKINKDPERIKMLKDIGFKYISNNDKWMKRYNELKEYVEKHGRFPRTCDNRSLSIWLMSWYRNSASKFPERVQMLIDLGFVPPKKNESTTQGKK